MALRINHNISAMNTLRNMRINDGAFSKSLEKLSSGYKINVAADDPSGLIISEQLRSQVNGLDRAIRNSQEASNVIGITEGALIEMNEILRKMRGLALHSANNGITAPDQIRADQAEIDSGIQTLDRIANTTRYSDQYLLNGSKGLVYDRGTTVDESMDHSLLDVNFTRIDQVFKREGAAMSISHSGTLSTTQANAEQIAQKGYFEMDPANGDYAIDIDANSQLTADQAFIVTGTSGSRAFRFGTGTDLGAMVDGINNVSDSVGASAALIFDSTVTPDVTAASKTGATITQYTNGQVQLYGKDVSGNTKVIGTDVTAAIIAANTEDSLRAGVNTDGDGNIYARVVSNDGATVDIEFYKDEALSMLVGEGSSTGAATTFTAANGSGIPNNAIALYLQPGANVLADDVYTLGFAGLDMNNAAVDTSGLTGVTNLDTANSVISGLDLANNTDPNGNLYIRTTGPSNARDVYVYRDSEMKAEDLVAQAEGVNLAAAGAARLHSVTMPDGSDSGLNMTIQFSGAAANNLEETGQISFNNLAARLYTNDYGSDQYLRVQNIEGNFWGSYQDSDSQTMKRIDPDTTVQVLGSDAEITVNGSPISTLGLESTVTTQDYSGELVFEEGALGETTIAQVGYNVGGIFSRAGSLQTIVELEPAGTDIGDIFTYATNPRKSTTEVLDNFIGGMQYQLGEGEGDQERIVYGIPSMAAANIGKVVDNDSTYTLQDVLAGGEAGLARDPILALKVVTKALNDVSELRARLGAFQKNMLQTNINSLNVAVENITATESAIRDANMAEETTEFTKNQILMQAGTAMLAQANTASQNILQLLG